MSAYQALEQAAEWFAELSDAPSAARRQAWQHWLQASPEHAAAWRRVEAINAQFRVLPDTGSRQAARKALQPDTAGRRQLLGMALVLGAGGLLAAGGTRLPWGAWLASERTATGEIRQLRLADGSQLWLGTRTAVDLDFQADWRRLQLQGGEILLQTAADPRPLWVETRVARLQALGTRFTVRTLPAAVQLVVFEGAVRVQPEQGATQRIEAGQQVRIERSGCGPLQPADPARQAWSRGVLLADNRRLGDFISELAEYLPGYLACDPRVSELRLVGAFPLSSPQRILQALEQSLPVRVHRRLPWWITVEPLAG